MCQSARTPSLVVGALGGLLIGAAAAWGGTRSYDVTFETKGQSMWQPGTAAFDFNKSYFLGPQWGAIPFDPPALESDVVTGFVSGQLNAGRVGLEANLQATTGSVNVTYPVRLSYTTPDAYTPGGKVRVGTSFAPLSTHTLKPTLSTRGPALKANLDLVMDISATLGYGVHVALTPPCNSGQAEAGIPNPIPQDLRDRHRGDVTLDLLPDALKRINLASVGGGTLSKQLISDPTGTASLSLNVPDALNLETQTLSGLNLKVGDSARPPVIAAAVDVVPLLNYAANLAGIPLPPLQKEVSIKCASLSYKILSGKFEFGPKFRQDFEFRLNGLPVVLTANTGEVRRGKIGDTFEFTAPDRGKLVIDAVVDIDQSFINNTGLAIGADFTLSVLQGEASAFGYTLANFGPVYQKPFTLAESDPISLFSRSFSLQGFASARQQLEIVPEPATLIFLAVGTLGLAGAGRRRNVRA
ncbi:MAG: PEP-CTERM sorting domain-containing protein [Phycisphaerae bacterium]|jgi:hypothetical protein